MGEILMSVYCFEPFEEEIEAIEAWKLEHQASNDCIYDRMCCSKSLGWSDHAPNEPHTTNLRYTGASGGQFSYEFAPTGLGTCVTVKCACGKKKNCTDYDSW